MSEVNQGAYVSLCKCSPHTQPLKNTNQFYFKAMLHELSRNTNQIAIILVISVLFMDTVCEAYTIVSVRERYSFTHSKFKQSYLYARIYRFHQILCATMVSTKCMSNINAQKYMHTLAQKHIYVCVACL